MRKGSPVAFVSIHTKDNETRIFRRSSMGNHPNHFKISLVYYCNASSPDFQCIITTAYGLYIMYQWTYMCTLNKTCRVWLRCNISHKDTRRVPMHCWLCVFLHRFLYTCEDCQNRIQKMAFVQYAFDRNEHAIELKPHGNLKKRSQVVSPALPASVQSELQKE